MAKVASMAGRQGRQGEIDWNPIILKAKEIVESYDTGVTLRQLYYRIVSLGLIPNHQGAYKTLSAKTAAARREGWFPNLIDRTREIELYGAFDSPNDALNHVVEGYRRDRTEGQDWAIYIGVEKHGMTTQLMHWFGDLGIPVLALGGYSSQTFVDVVKSHVAQQGKQSVLLYAGDFDPSGMDIDRDFTERGDCFDEIIRVALTREIVEQFKLPPMPGKSTDSRAGKFIAKHGDLVQVELDALDPADLRKLYTEAIDEYFNHKQWKSVVRRESKERSQLQALMSMVDSETDFDRMIAAMEQVDEMEDIDRFDENVTRITDQQHIMVSATDFAELERKAALYDRRKKK